jgi:hypothetical protein
MPLKGTLLDKKSDDAMAMSVAQRIVSYKPDYFLAQT